MHRRHRILLTVLVFHACSDDETTEPDLSIDPDLSLDHGLPDNLDGILRDEVSSDGPDAEDLIDPWDKPEPLRVFQQGKGFMGCFRPRILSDGSGGVIVVASAVATCDGTEEEPCWSLFAQRISGQGERLWGNDGIRLIDVEFPDGYCLYVIDLVRKFELAADGSGGIFIVWQAGSGELDLLVNRIRGDGTRSFTYLEPMQFPIDELAEARGYVPGSLGVGAIARINDEKLLMSLQLEYGSGDSDYYLSVIDPDWNAGGYSFVATGSLIGSFYRMGDGGILHAMRADPYFVEVGTVSLTAWFIDGEGAVLGRDAVDLEYNSFAFGIVDYDEGASALFLHDTNLVTRITVLPLTHELRWDWQWVGYGGVQEFTGFAGDGAGGIFLSGRQEVPDDPDSPGCRPETCRTVLVHHWLDSSGSDRVAEEDMALDSFASISWHPDPKVLRSLDGDILHVWNVPLVHQGSADPDCSSYKKGYYLCAQRHSLNDRFVWDEEPCKKVAQMMDLDLSPYETRIWWLDAVEDGEGGLIAAFDTASDIMVQRVSSDGNILWDGRE
jgi:hypothetical protein